MRTTLTIDDDVLAAARERAQREGRSLGEVLSQLARAGLTASASGPRRARHGFRPLPARDGIVTNELIDDLLDDSE